MVGSDNNNNNNATSNTVMSRQNVAENKGLYMVKLAEMLLVYHNKGEIDLAPGFINVWNSRRSNYSFFLKLFL